MAKPMSRKIAPNHFDLKRQRRRAKTHILYRCYDATNTLLYVGMTNDPETRIQYHRRNQPWWHHVDHIRLQNLPNRDALVRAETAAIQLEQPLYNIVNANIRAQSRSRSRLGARGFQMWPEANHFGTREPQGGHLIDMSPEQMRYPCSQCKVRGIY